ncbi:MAG: AbrB family transcriptional regulator [Pseudomonadota bacterium]
MRNLPVWLAALAIAASGGAVAAWIGTPLPWLLGAMVSTAVATMAGLKIGGQPLDFPQPVRHAFITVIGVAIGGAATEDMWGEIWAWWPSLVAVLVFVAVAQTANYQIFRRIAGYDRPTAFYAATPGGLIESVQLGEEAGGDPVLLTVQHFARITLTVSIVPLLYWAMRGEAVGSAAGVSLQGEPISSLADVFVLVACAALGGWGGRRLGIPAAIITGPILLSMLAHGTGMTDAKIPDWAIALAQLVVGLGLAARFQGMGRDLLLQGIGYGAVTVTVMLMIAAGISWAVWEVGGKPFQILFMAYAPGGVVEMGLIALSLGASPVMVTLHHIVRILCTVLLVPIVGRWVIRDP